MENLVVISKVKKFIKEKGGMNTSAAFFDKLNQDIFTTCKEGIEHAQKAGRKTVMGRDFNLYVENPQIEEALVVATKVKRVIKENGGLSTSSQVVDQLTYRVQQSCLKAIANATEDKRKTVMDRDFTAPTASPASNF